MNEKAKEELKKAKSRNKNFIESEDGKHSYRRVSIGKTKLSYVDKDSASADIALLVAARTNILDITENSKNVEELTYTQKQEILFFLERYLPYLKSAVSLKTKYMSTSVSIKIPDSYNLGAFRKQTIVEFYKDILSKMDGFIYNIFFNYNLYGSAYLLAADNWEENFYEKAEKEGIQKNILSKISKIDGMDLPIFFKWLEKNPDKARLYFQDLIDIEENLEYKKLEEIFNTDPETLTGAQLDKMSKMATPLMNGLELFQMQRSLSPAHLGNSIFENIDTGSLDVKVDASKLLLQEDEMIEINQMLQEYQSKHRISEESQEHEPDFEEDTKKVEARYETLLSKLVFKGYSRSWVKAHLFSDYEDNSVSYNEAKNSQDKVNITNDPYKDIYVFRIKDESVLEDISNADTLIESAIDLLNCEIRQRSYINDTREKLITLSVSGSAEASISADMMSDIVDDLSSSVMTGESSIITLPEGISLNDDTSIIRASNDTDKLEAQSKSNIALFFSMSTSMLEDSEAQFSNTFLKIDTAQNMFSLEREEITRMLVDKILKPAAVKAGLFCRNKQGKVVIAVPELLFDKISIGRHSEDYNSTRDLVRDKLLPKDELYSYHNTSKEEVASRLLEDALSLDNPDVLQSLTNKMLNLVDEDQTGEMLVRLLKGDTLSLIKHLKKTPEAPTRIGSEEGQQDEAE